jgi:hypothetical protein
MRRLGFPSVHQPGLCRTITPGLWPFLPLGYTACSPRISGGAVLSQVHIAGIDASL